VFTVYVDEVRISECVKGDGAATEKELFESWSLNRGTIKSHAMWMESCWWY